MEGIYKDRISSKAYLQNKGSISIFLAVVIFALSFMIFFSAARLAEGKKEEERYFDVDLAIRSVLADYDREIFRDYGLTVLGYGDADEMEREFDRILINNGFENTGRAFVRAAAPLGDEGVLDQMILEYMESRIVSKIASEIAAKFGILGALSGFKELLEKKSYIESIIFDCEKILAGIITGIDGINRLDMERIAGGDLEYLSYKLDEVRRFAAALESLLASLESLECEKEKLDDKNGFFSEIASRVDIFSKSTGKIREAVRTVRNNISLLLTCLDMIDNGEDAVNILAGYICLEMDIGSLLPGISPDEMLEGLDLRSAERNILDQIFLNTGREDRVLSGSEEGLLPYDGRNGTSIFDRIEKFKDFFTDISFEGVLEKAAGHVMLVEYIIDRFSCETDVIPGRYYNDEVEYILFGRCSQNDNLKSVKSCLLLLRAALNYISIHMDSEKTALARSVGAAVSTLTFGIGGGIISELVISSWAVYEAYNDIELLLEGKKTAVLKSKGDFSIDFGTGDGAKSPVKAGYKDYLRLFLYFAGEDVKLGRILNLISINTGTDVSLMFTSIIGGYADEFKIEKGY